VVNDFRYTEHQVTRFRIPDGYEISYLPDNDVIDNEIISAYFRYSVNDGYITLDKEIKYKFLLLQSDQVKLWNSTVDRLNGNYRLSVALNKSVTNS
jgi:hypothetical protein